MEESTKKKLGAGLGIFAVILTVIASYLLGREVSFEDTAADIGGYIKDAQTQTIDNSAGTAPTVQTTNK
jgi:hypothetical protein